MQSAKIVYCEEAGSWIGYLQGQHGNSVRGSIPARCHAASGDHASFARDSALKRRPIAAWGTRRFRR